MNEQYDISIAVILSGANLLLAAYASWKDLRRPLSLSFLFWLASLLFVGIPLFVDSCAVALGCAKQWSEMVESIHAYYVYDLSSDTLVRTSLFVLLFNVLFFVGFKSRSIWARIRKGEIGNTTVLRTQQTSPLWIFVPCVLGWIGWLMFVSVFGFELEERGFGYVLIRTAEALGGLEEGIFARLSGVFLTLSGVGVFFAIKEKKYFQFILTAFPSLSIGWLTSARTYLVPVFACTLYALAYTGKGGVRKALLRVSIAGLLFIVVSLSVRRGISGLQQLVAHNPPYPVNRDTSTNILNYCFSERGLYNDPGTRFLAVKRLLRTGFRPRLLFGPEEDTPQVITYVAEKRFHWEHGSLHPTIYGWFFVDMRWYGVLVAIPLGLVLSILEGISAKNLLLRVIIIAILSMFLLVAMRGSVQVGYSRAIYALFAGFGLFALERLIQPPGVSIRPTAQSARSANRFRRLNR